MNPIFGLGKPVNEAKMRKILLFTLLILLSCSVVFICKSLIKKIFENCLISSFLGLYHVLTGKGERISVGW